MDQHSIQRGRGKGGVAILHALHATETGLNSGRVGHVSSNATLPLHRLTSIDFIHVVLRMIYL